MKKRKLKWEPNEKHIFMTERPLNPKMHREKTTEIVFEKFKPSCFYLGIQSVLSLYASGRTSGQVVDIGEGVFHSVPVYEGYSLPHAIKRMGLVAFPLLFFL